MPFPDHIAIIGGGRWARVLIEVLCDIVQPCTRLSVCTPHNSVSMSNWASNLNVGLQIDVSSDLPKFFPEEGSVVIVTNAARDHEKAIEFALSEGVPVLVEKPIGLNFHTSQRLAKLANSNNTFLATAHVFLFARYVEAFSKLINNTPLFVSVTWMDPIFENRHGENKSYDAGLPVFADWLPHIVSIVGTLTKNHSLRYKKLEFLKGGSHLNIDLTFGEFPLNIQLIRNGHCRQRIIEVSTSMHNKVKLDFSDEPGTITSDSMTVCGDPEWNIKQRPVAEMLGTFLKGISNGIHDNRFDNRIGLNAMKIIDQIATHYQASVNSWLRGKLSSDIDTENPELVYALTEIIKFNDPDIGIPMDRKINYISLFISDYTKMKKHSKVISKSPVEFILSILEKGKETSYNFNV